MEALHRPQPPSPDGIETKLDYLFEDLEGHRYMEALGHGGQATTLLMKDPAGNMVVGKLYQMPLISLESSPNITREAEILSRLDHPSLPKVHSVIHSSCSDSFLLIQEHIPGETLEETLEQHGPIPPADVGKLAHELLEVTGYVHNKGIIHRDIKPRNIIMGDRSHLIDFGIATDSTHTFTTMRVQGTSGYRAPELMGCIGATPSSDLYSLGATLIAALLGKLPEEIATYQHSAGYSIPRNDVPETLRSALEWMVAWNPEERPQSAQEVLTHLSGETYSEPPIIENPPRPENVPNIKLRDRIWLRLKGRTQRANMLYTIIRKWITSENTAPQIYDATRALCQTYGIGEKTPDLAERIFANSSWTSRIRTSGTLQERLDLATYLARRDLTSADFRGRLLQYDIAQFHADSPNDLEGKRNMLSQLRDAEITSDWMETLEARLFLRDISAPRTSDIDEYLEQAGSQLRELRDSGLCDETMRKAEDILLKGPTMQTLDEIEKYTMGAQAHLVQHSPEDLQHYLLSTTYERRLKKLEFHENPDEDFHAKLKEVRSLENALFSHPRGPENATALEAKILDWVCAERSIKTRTKRAQEYSRHFNTEPDESGWAPWIRRVYPEQVQRVERGISEREELFGRCKYIEREWDKKWEKIGAGQNGKEVYLIWDIIPSNREFRRTQNKSHRDGFYDPVSDLNESITNLLRRLEGEESDMPELTHATRERLRGAFDQIVEPAYERILKDSTKSSMGRHNYWGGYHVDKNGIFVFSGIRSYSNSIQRVHEIGEKLGLVYPEEIRLPEEYFVGREGYSKIGSMLIGMVGGGDIGYEMAKELAAKLIPDKQILESAIIAIDNRETQDRFNF